MSWVSHDHLEACSVFHLSLPSLKSHVSTFACSASPAGAASRGHAGLNLRDPRSARVRLSLRPGTGGRQERSSCGPRSSHQIEGDAGRLVNRHRCTDLSRTVCGRTGKVTLSPREGGGSQQHVLCHWSFREETKSQMRRILPEPAHWCGIQTENIPQARSGPAHAR